jgi:3,4-dihydroxy 2-butanone 4-phosphate synthase/GTP cyclohydrolase II
LTNPPDIRNFLSKPEEIINEARNGRMYILVDDEDRENEGDLIIPAQMVTPDAINFMATYGRGLICLAMTRHRCDQLGLAPMARENREAMETAFTVSIEAKQGVTTGISAADRARTISVAVDASMTAADIVSPGHVFPLTARDGGVLVRAGHTEAAVDISRLAGLNPSGVICEIMKDDGTMARMVDLIAFSQKHGLKIGTIRDLIAYRLRHDHNIERVNEAHFNSRFGGEWTAVVFRNKALNYETLALVKGQVTADRPTMVRMHAISIFEDMLGAEGQRCGIIQNAMRMISHHGAGVVVVITQQAPDVLSRLVRQQAGEAPARQSVDTLRDYGLGAQILAELGVHDMILLTNAHRSLVGLSGYGLSIVEERTMQAADE